MMGCTRMLMGSISYYIYKLLLFRNYNLCSDVNSSRCKVRAICQGIVLRCSNASYVSGGYYAINHKSSSRQVYTTATLSNFRCQSVSRIELHSRQRSDVDPRAGGRSVHAQDCLGGRTDGRADGRYVCRIVSRLL